MASQTPKTMSSRLLTMKFMQRAAATPLPPSPSTPKTDETSSKRRKVSHDESTIEIPTEAIQAAIDEGERKREEAAASLAEASGDGRWVLDVPARRAPSYAKQLNVVQEGFAQIDSSDTAAEHTSRNGSARKLYNMKKKKAPEEANEESSGSGSSDESDSENASGRNSYNDSSSSKQRRDSLKNALPNKRKAEVATAKELAEKRRKKELKLNKPSEGLASISSGGFSGGLSGGLSSGGTPVKKPGQPAQKCYKCGKPGHFAYGCKNK